jgi:hypothetical protein
LLNGRIYFNDFIIKIKENLYWKVNSSYNSLRWICASKSFDVPILNYLFQKDPQLEICWEDSHERSPPYCIIVKPSRLLELLQVIKSYEPTQTITPYNNICYSNQIRDVINGYAKN